MNEWEFTQLAATWMQQAIDADPSLPFRHARTEQTTHGSATRRDLTLLDAGNRPLLTGEVKMPYQPDGNSPYRFEVLRDARAKAKRAGCDYCFTWNVNRLVLWPTEPQVRGGQLGTADDAYQAWDVVDIYKPAHAQLEQNQAKIKRFLVGFLRDAAHIVKGDKALGWRKPDDKFVEALEAALEQPVLLTTDALADAYKKPKERDALQAWMRDEQGWTLADAGDARGTADNLESAARFANYALMNKVVFHEALVRRHPHDLAAIAIPNHVSAGDQLRTHLEGFFQRARDFTRDYETVFGQHQYAAVGPRIPFYADPAVAYWRELIAQIHEFDFSKLDYEVIGSLFERLISPEERHKFGQYYTRAEVVDLLNSYCIRTGRERVMDPACGGGTFLVRAYARKRELNPAGDHVGRLNELYGVDLSHFAANLTTINLATRDLISSENYPQVARGDFFDVEPTRALMNLPAKITAAGLGTGQRRDVHIEPLDAIIGNPPYVRQEDIPASTKRKKGEKAAGPKPGTKEHYQAVAARAAGLTFSGRSDLHVYFWPHAAEFLHHGGWLCLLTSSQWLDVDYGFRLQEYILRNFEVHAVYESVDEPWFVGARVVTCATVLRRQRNEADRMNHDVRFVQLRRPIADVLAHDGTTAGAMAAADALRDAVAAAKHNSVTPEYRVRVVRQGDLWRDGVRVGQLVRGKKGRKPEKQAAMEGQQGGQYFGGKWGQHVRAPDLWFDLIDHCGDKLVPLAQVASVRFGVKSGNDGFFFPVDASAKMLARYVDPVEFEEVCGVSRREVESGVVKMVRCGEKLSQLRPLEASLLQPEVHNLKDVKGFVSRAGDCRRLILLTGEATDALPSYGQEYVRWGESQGWHAKPTCAGRVTDTRAWHDLTGSHRGAMFWSMQQQYRHVIPTNDAELICNHNLFDIDARDGDDAALAGVLNSTIAILAKHIYGRPVGVEGNQKTEVIDVKMMLIPDTRQGEGADHKRIANAFEEMKRRRPLNLISPREFQRTRYEQKGEHEKLAALSDECELDQPDRRVLDDAVLRMLGYGEKAERARLLDAMYAHLRHHFIGVRRKEEKANANKTKAKKRGRGSAGAQAQAIVEQLRRDHPEVFRRYPQHFIDPSILAAAMIDTFDVPKDGVAESVELLTGRTVVRLAKGKRTLAELHPASAEQGRLIVDLIRQGLRGLVTVPHDPIACIQVQTRFLEWVRVRDETISGVIGRHTADEAVGESLRALVTPVTSNDARHMPTISA